MLPKIDCSGYLTDQEAAAALGYSVVHFRRLRRQGVGPAYIRRGRSVMYAGADLESWLEDRRVDPANF